MSIKANVLLLLHFVHIERKNGIYEIVRNEYIDSEKIKIDNNLFNDDDLDDLAVVFKYGNVELRYNIPCCDLTVERLNNIATVAYDFNRNKKDVFELSVDDNEFSIERDYNRKKFIVKQSHDETSSELLYSF